MEQLSDVVLHLQRFTWPDYSMFGLMLLLCIFIGIYFGFIQKTKCNELEYLVGGRNMKVFPIALSLIASFISGITMLGLPTEVYSFGVQYLYVMGGVILMGIAMSRLYLPVFHDLKITSTYEYLETRFDWRLRMFGAIMFTIMNFCFLPIVVYVPALAFNQVTGVNVHVITPILCVICVFYTCVGGLKAVVWTDVVQTFSMFGALILVAVKGTIDLGGSSIVFDEAWKSGRFEAPILDINPTIRHTLWSQVIGGFCYWLQTGAISQNMIQRFLSLPTVRTGRQALWIFVGGIITLMLLCAYNGLLIYATYRHCDPLTTKLARARDQLLPLFVMDTLGEIPGLSGLFIAGVFSAALSSLSTCLNSMSAVVLEDFCKPFVKQPLSDLAVNWIMRSVVVCVGMICVALVVVVQKMGTVLQLTMSLESVTNGPLLGIFTIGILLPWINGNSALLGGIVSVLFMSWVSLSTQYAIAAGALKFESKITSVDDCPYTFDYGVSLANNTLVLDEDEIFPLYRTSYMWYTCYGAVITIIVALLSTIIFGTNRTDDIDANLIAPCMRKYMHRDERKQVQTNGAGPQSESSL